MPFCVNKGYGPKILEQGQPGSATFPHWGTQSFWQCTRKEVLLEMSQASSEEMETFTWEPGEQVANPHCFTRQAALEAGSSVRLSKLTRRQVLHM